MSIYILGIESSCDETAAAVIKNGILLSNIIATQTIHQNYGGVVPELASRAHQSIIIPVVTEALEQAKITIQEITAVVCTQGPGLLGSLMVGVSYSKGLALALDIPLIAVHHLHAHIHAHFLQPKKPSFPFLCLTVSGGHTQIVLVEDYLKMKILGETIDDAAGEAFDKAAKMLQISYPGGPVLDQYAKSGNPNAFVFPIPKIKDLNFSFSGIKTSILYFLQNQTKNNKNFIQENLNDLCASIQHTIVEALFQKMEKAINTFGITTIALAGGVAANSGLRKKFEVASKQYGWELYIPNFSYCTDNAAMVAITGYYQYLKGDFSDQSLIPKARLEF